MTKPGYGPTVVGDTQLFTFVGRNDLGEPENVTGHSITFLAFDESGNEIEKTVGDGIELLTQSGETLGHFTVRIENDDYPETWAAWRPKDKNVVGIELERSGERSGVAFTKTLQETWELKGQAIR
jgi:hypothetical protein